MPERLLEPADFEALAEELLNHGSSFRFQASGMSMRPFILHGDLVVITPLSGAPPLKRGTVVLCRLAPNFLVVHRVIRVKVERGETRLLIQGDAILHPDGWIAVGQVLGVALSVVRGEHPMRLDSRLSQALAALWLWAEPLRPALLRVGQAVWQIMKRLH